MRGCRRHRERRVGLAAVVMTMLALWSSHAVAQQNGSALLERRAGLVVTQVSVLEALAELQRASGVVLAFSQDVLPQEVRVDCPCSDVTVRAALERILEGTDLIFVASRRQIVVGKRPAPTSGSPLPDGPLVGRVVEAEDGRPVTLAEIWAEGGSPRAVSGDNGRFVLQGLGSGPRQLSVHALGYRDTTVVVATRPSPGEPLTIPLARAPIELYQMIIAPGRIGVLEASPTASGSTVTREEIEAIPQFGDDVFRTLKRMPGVAASDISTKLNVRGSLDRDLLVRLDGLELYEPYHLKDVDGGLGIVDVQALGSIDLVTGGFGPEFGDKMGGVFDMRSRAAPQDGTRTTLGLSLSSLSAMSQGSFGGGRGQWLGSLRRGFLRYILEIGGASDDLSPNYWDGLFRAQYLVGDHHLVWGDMLFAGDEMTWKDNEGRSQVHSNWSNRYAWVGWRAEIGGRTRVETILSAGGLRRNRQGDVDNPDRGDFTPLTAAVTDDASFGFDGLKQDWSVDVTEDLVLKAGVDYRAVRGDYDYLSTASRYDVDASGSVYIRTDDRQVAVDPHGHELGSYLALRGRPGGRLTWEGGIRYDRETQTGDGDLAPRLLVRWDVDRGTTLRASVGRYVQSQGLHELSVQDGEQSFSSSERADQLALGVEKRFPSGISARLEAYRRRVGRPRPVYLNLSRAITPVSEVQSDRQRLAPERARAKGLELSLSGEGTGALGWTASYALAQSEDRIAGTWVPRPLDQRHTLNLFAEWRLGDSWQLSGSWQYHTGWPFTEQFLEVEVSEEEGGQSVNVVRHEFGPVNAERLPAYHRLDLRLTHVFRFEKSRLETYLDLFNAYGRTNLRGLNYGLRQVGDRLVTVRTGGEELLPRLPTMGFRWIF